MPAPDGAAGVAEPAAPRRSRPWLRLVLVAAGALFVALLAYGVLSKAPDETIDDSLASGEPATAPAFELPVLQSGEAGPELEGPLRRASADGRIALDELRGTPVVLNFWASWCEPCRSEAAVLEDGWERAQRDGTRFLGLNMQDLTADAREFMAEQRTTYPSVRDESNGVALDWGVTGLPETFFLSADGEVVAHAIGAISSEQLELGLEAAEEGRPLPSIEGGERRSVE